LIETSENWLLKMQMPSAPTENLGKGLTASETSNRAHGHSPPVSRQHKPSVSNDGFSERVRPSSEIEQTMMDTDHQTPTPKSNSSNSTHKLVSSPRVSTGALSLQGLCAASEMLDGSSPTSEASSGRKRRIPPGPGLRWCAGGSGGGGRWIDARDEAAFGLDAFDKFPPPRRPRHEDLNPPNSSAGIKPLSIRPKHRVIGNGIFISGGRVMMNDSTSGEEKITICTFCRRSFISSHALDVHLSRNQSCRNEKDKAQTQSFGSTSSIGRGPSARPLSPTLERCRGIVQSLIKRPEASPFNDPFDHRGADVVDPKSAMDLNTVMNKLNCNIYRFAREVQDDVLKIWRNSYRYHGPSSEVYGSAKALSLLFESLFDAAFDHVRGFGGRADIPFFKHGTHWIGRRVKVLWSREHDRITGVIDDYNQIDDEDHIYHIVYDDTADQWATLPNKKVEILGWVGDEEENRSTSILQGQKTPQHQPRTNVHPSVNLGGGSVDKGKPMESTSHQLLTGVEKNLADRLSVAPNAYPSTKMHNTSTDLTRKSSDGSIVLDDVVKVRCPVFKEGQEVVFNEYAARTSMRRGKVFRINSNGTYDIVHSANEERLDKFVLEEDLRAPEGAINYGDLITLVKELRGKAQSSSLDEPADYRKFPGYYHPNPAAHQRGITGWHTQCMCFNWMERKASLMQYSGVPAVESDFNLIIYNAIVFHSQGHPINREARRIYQEAKGIFAKWARKPGCYGCKVCGRADSAESPMLLCDHCCQGIHQNCFLLPGSRVLSLLTQDVYHPLRGDTAFFCGEDCHRRFVAIKMRFKLPVVSIPQSKIHSGIPNAQGPLPSAAVLPSEPPSDVQEGAGKAQNDDPKIPSSCTSNCPLILVPNLARENVVTESQGSPPKAVLNCYFQRIK